MKAKDVTNSSSQPVEVVFPLSRAMSIDIRDAALLLLNEPGRCAQVVLDSAMGETTSLDSIWRYAVRGVLKERIEEALRLTVGRLADEAFEAALLNGTTYESLQVRISLEKCS